MRNWKLFGKIGAIALTALGLSLLPGNFNVPGVGSVQAFAGDTLVDLAGATVTVQPVNYKNAAYNPESDLTWTIKDDKDETMNAENKAKIKLTCAKEIKDAGTYELALAYAGSDTTTVTNLDRVKKLPSRLILRILIQD